MASSFELLAAMDLRDGRVVRLVQGDFARQTVYGDDPLTTARALASTGVRWLHIVDLDGARAGTPRQASLIADVIQAVVPRVACQVGGGLRTERDVDEALGHGAARVVLGTAALADPPLAGRLVRRYGADRVACAIDVRAGRAHGHAWAAGTSAEPALEVAARLASVGVSRFVVTAIERDGLLEGPNLELLAEFVGSGVGDIVASGGMSSIADLEVVRDLGCSGAIVGRAVYEGRLDLGEAVRRLATPA
jgi:phosphoribosylformimino-5-aminoimidazole carboxamide ribotide isomerase